MTLIEGIVGSIIAAAIVGLIVAGYKYWFGQQIKITDPRRDDFLAPAETNLGVVAHAVQGTARHVPNGHKIWLLVMDESKGKVWPQGFAPVVYDRENGTWKGYVHVWGWHHVTIAAVIAPPTSQDFFNYFQRMGRDFKTGYEPIVRIPPECKKRDVVQAKVPPPQGKP